MDEAKRRETIEYFKERFEMAAYFARAVMEELGEERAMAVISKAYEAYHIDQVEAFKREKGENSWELWIERLRIAAEHPTTVKGLTEVTDEHCAMRVSDCLVLEAWRELGVPQVCLAYCDSDYAMARSYNGGMSVTREHELARGDDHCDHVWHFRK